MFRAFFDESGFNPLRDRVLVMGGFLASVEEWEKASDAWDRCLNEHPEIQYFSHHEAKSLGGEFRTFSGAQAAEKVMKLAKVIAEFDLQGFCATVSYSWFASKDKRASRKTVGTRAYDWGFLTAISGVLQYVNLVHGDDKVDFIFDRRPELPACIATYEELKSGSLMPPGLAEVMSLGGECMPGDDKVLVAIQMADLLSGEFHDFLRNRKPTEIWKVVASRPVAHMPCKMPPQVPQSFEIQKMAREVQDYANNILKRIYKNKERSVELLIDVGDLAQRKAFFDLQLQRFKAPYLEDKEYREFIKRREGKRTK